MSSLDISSLSATYGSSNTLGAAPETASQELGKEEFLNLLIAQLQAQDPLNPQDPQEFVAQLAQFSQVEQLMTANANLTGMLEGMLALNNLSAVGLLGAEVVAVSDAVRLDGEQGTTLAFHAEAAGEATLVVKDSSGNTVYTRTVTAEDGLNEVSWDGRDDDGEMLPAGEYTLSVTVTGEGGEEIAAMPVMRGTVDGVSFESGSAVLVVDGVEVPLYEVVSVDGVNDEPAEEESSTEASTGDGAEDASGVEVTEVESLDLEDAAELIGG